MNPQARQQAVTGAGPALPEAPVAPREERPAEVVVAWARPSVRAMVTDAWEERRLLRPLGARLINKGFSGTLLGPAWLFIRPAFAIFGMTLLFGGVLRTPSQGIPYVAFLMAGMIGWGVFQAALIWSTRSFQQFRRLLRLRIPPLLVPLAGSVPAAMTFGIYMIFFVGALVYYLITKGTLYLELGPQLLVAVCGLALGVALALGLGLWLSVLNARWRDVWLALRLVLRVWLVITPVVYPIRALPGAWQTVAAYNPMAPVVNMVKYGLVGGADVELASVASGVGITAVVIASGLWFFSRMARSMHIRAAGDEDEEDDEAGL